MSIRVQDHAEIQLLDEWLGELRKARWTFYYFPGRQDPAAIAAVYRWRAAVDVFALFGNGTGLAYRSPMPADANPFHPAVVSWTFGGDPVWAIRGVLALPEPQSPDEPVWIQHAPPLCRVLRDLVAGGYVIRPPQVPDPVALAGRKGI